MTERQKLLIVTVFYNPAVIHPEAITGSEPFTGLEDCLEQGSLVRISHVEAALLRLACDQLGRPPAHEWVGLAFVPVQPAVSEALIVEEEAHA